MIRWRGCGDSVYSPSFSSPWRSGWRPQVATSANSMPSRHRRRRRPSWWTAAVRRRLLLVSIYLSLFFSGPGEPGRPSSPCTHKLTKFVLPFCLQLQRQIAIRRRRRRRVAPASRRAYSLSYIYVSSVSSIKDWEKYVPINALYCYTCVIWINLVRHMHKSTICISFNL